MISKPDGAPAAVPSAADGAWIRWAAAAVAILALLFPLVPGIATSWITMAVYIGMAALVSIGLVLLTGVGGMTSFGQAAFVGIGAYATAYLTSAHGFSPWLTLPISLLLTAAGALVIGFVTVPLAGHYLSIATIAWSVSIYYVFGTSQALGMSNGLYGLKPVSIGSFEFTDARAYFYLVWVALVLAVTVTGNLLSSRTGRSIRALRDGAIVASAFGINVVRAKLGIFVFSAVLAGLSGWLYAHFQRAVSPSSFGIEYSLEYLLMAVVGGSGHIYGAIVGSAIIVALRSELQLLLHNVLGLAGNYEVIALGVILIVVLHVAGDGVWPLLRRYLPRVSSRTPARADPLPVATMPAGGSPLLSVDKLRIEFGGLIAVNDVSFDLAAGEVVALIGPNGAGKSTTFNLLTGLLKPTAGTIDFKGIRLDGSSPQAVAQARVARTFQHAEVVPDMSVLENVALGAHLRSSSGPWRAMMKLNRAEERRILFEAARCIQRVGLFNEMHKPAGSLALGQLRLVEVARALAMDPVLLLLDEPAAGLRHPEKQRLAELLRSLRADGMSVLLVEHDMDFVMNLVDKIVVLNFGTKIAQGSPAEVRNNPSVREAYLGPAE